MAIAVSTRGVMSMINAVDGLIKEWYLAFSQSVLVAVHITVAIITGNSICAREFHMDMCILYLVVAKLIALYSPLIYIYSCSVVVV